VRRQSIANGKRQLKLGGGFSIADFSFGAVMVPSCTAGVLLSLITRQGVLPSAATSLYSPQIRKFRQSQESLTHCCTRESWYES
jgi:hypothetical protein